MRKSWEMAFAEFKHDIMWQASHHDKRAQLERSALFWDIELYTDISLRVTPSITL